MREWLKHLLLPHQTNNHRPRALHSKTIFLYILFFLLLQLSFRTISRVRPDILGVATNITVERLLQLTNQKRIENGLPPLTLNPLLSQAAQKKAEDMFAKDYWAHTAPDGVTPWDFILKAGYRYLFAGENLAKEFNDSESVVSAWMNSPSHRENILRPEYEEIGLAVVNGRLNGRETTLVVQMFGKRQKALAQKPAPQLTIEKKTSSQITPSPILSPSPTPVLLAQAQGIKTPPLGVVKKPLIDRFSFTKNFSLILLGGLLTILTLDGIIILRRRTVRVAGHNLAHFIFLLALMGVVLLSTSGAIL